MILEDQLLTGAMESLFAEAWEGAFQKQGRPKPGSIHLSESGFDPRYRLAKAKGLFYSPFDTQTLYLFAIGNFVETLFLDSLDKTMRKKNLKLERYRHGDPEQKKKLMEVYTPWGQTGRMDAYLPDFNAVVEVKSTGTGNMEKAPIPYNVWQLQAYMHKEFNKRPVDRGSFFYIDRGGSNKPRTFLSYPHKETQAEIYHVLQKLNEAKNMELEEFPKDEWWGVDFKKYYVPRDFAVWAVKNFAMDKVMDFTNYINEEKIRGAQLAKMLLQGKKDGTLIEEEEKKLKGQLHELFELGYDCFACSLGQVKGSLIKKEELNIKKAKENGVEIKTVLHNCIKEAKEDGIKTLDEFSEYLKDYREFGGFDSYVRASRSWRVNTKFNK